MKIQVFAILFIGVAFANIVEQADQQKQEEMDMMLLGNESHDSWCTVKAYWKNKWCLTKATFGAINDATAKANRKAACAGTYDFDIQNCAATRRLSGYEKHDYSRCQFKLDAKKYWCFVRAFFHTDSAVKTSEKAKCEADYQVNLALCPAQRRLSAGKKTASKHRLFCNFKAWSAKNWCKAKNLTKASTQKTIANSSCDAQYNLALANCATQRLLKRMESSIQAGNAHESWASFVSRMKWIGCKTKAALTIDSVVRKANLAKCDSDYQARKALEEAANVVVNAN